MTSTAFDPMGMLLPADPERRLKRGLFVVLFLSFSFFGSTPSWNPNSRFDLVRAVVEQGTLSIDSFHENTGDKSLHEEHYYSDKAPGLSMLAIPIHAVQLAIRVMLGRPPDLDSKGFSISALYLATLLTVGLLSAALGVVLFGVCRRLGASSTRALWVTIAYSYGTPAFAYSTLFFGHQAAAAFLLFGFALMLQTPSWKRDLAAGGSLCFAVVCEYPTAVLVLVMVGYRLRNLVRTGAFREFGGVVVRLAAGAAVPAALLGAYNWACFGAPWRIGYGSLAPSTFSVGMSPGIFGVSWPRAQWLWGTTFGGNRGLFPIAPVVLLAFGLLVWAALKSRWRAEAAVAVICFVTYIGLNSGYAFWNGGASFGPRHVVPALPFVMLGLIAIPRGRRWLMLAGTLGLVSAVNAVGATAVGADLPEWGNALTKHVWPALWRGDIPLEPHAYNLGLVLGLEGTLSLVPFAVFVGSALPVLHGVARESNTTPD